MNIVKHNYKDFCLNENMADWSLCSAWDRDFLGLQLKLNSYLREGWELLGNIEFDYHPFSDLNPTGKHYVQKLCRRRKNECL